MQVTLEDVGKKFRHEWIFRNLSYVFQPHQAYGLVGPNGSGKSTLLLMISALLSTTRGSIRYSLDGQSLDADMVYQHLTLAAPYQELIEDFTLQEMLDFHFALKKPVSGLDIATIIKKMRLERSREKYIRQFSSGMKQRLKLGLAMYSGSQMILLDEPCANLDQENIQWYQEEIRTVLGTRLVIIASNQPYEYDFCDKILDIVHFK